MFDPDSLSARYTRAMNRYHARASTRARAATAFVSTPEPRTIGVFAKGRQLLTGNFLFAGHLVTAPDTSIWDLDAPDPEFAQDLHGFAWLDDFAAVGDAPCREKAQLWVWRWMDRYGKGHGPGWVPELTARRLIRWVNHAVFLLQGQDKDQQAQFFQSLAQQMIFLSRRWSKAPAGLQRFEALTGLIYGGLALQGMAKHVAPALKALGRECQDNIDAEGGLPSRNPEELLDVFTLLSWVGAALADAEQTLPEELATSIERIAPTLRTLRHTDGGLARFHGGGRGLEGRLDSALAASQTKSRQPDGLAMGFARLSGGRTSVIVDASPPAVGDYSTNAHASTLAFELTSGRRPVIVNCGSGASFGEDWRRAGRATASHTTVAMDGFSSARLGESGRGWRDEQLVDAPDEVPIQMSSASDGMRFEGGHDGFVKTHGLTHARTLELTFDGKGLAGEDLLLALKDNAKRQFDRVMDSKNLLGIPFQSRFHLHPDANAEIDMGGNAVSIGLKSGEMWIFRHDSLAKLTLEPSVYLEKGRLKPRAAKQIVLSGVAMEYATRIRWSLAKAQDSAMIIRDLHREELDLTQ